MATREETIKECIAFVAEFADKYVDKWGDTENAKASGWAILQAASELGGLIPTNVDSVPEKYKRLSNECCNVAGRGDWYWNERFVSALRHRGLKLSLPVLTPLPDERYPGGYPMQAPQAYRDYPEAWPDGAIIVWDNGL